MFDERNWEPDVKVTPGKVMFDGMYWEDYVDKGVTKTTKEFKILSQEKKLSTESKKILKKDAALTACMVTYRNKCTAAGG